MGSGDPEISVYTPPQEATNGNDGGTSEVQKLFDVEKTVITTTLLRRLTPCIVLTIFFLFIIKKEFSNLSKLCYFALHEYLVSRSNT